MASFQFPSLAFDEIAWQQPGGVEESISCHVGSHQLEAMN